MWIDAVDVVDLLLSMGLLFRLLGAGLCDIRYRSYGLDRLFVVSCHDCRDDL